MLANDPAIENFPLLMVGMLLLFLGTGIGLIAMTFIITDSMFYEMLFCMALPAILLLVGFYFVSDVAKNQTQLVDEHPSALTDEAPKV